MIGHRAIQPSICQSPILVASSICQRSTGSITYSVIKYLFRRGVYAPSRLETHWVRRGRMASLCQVGAEEKSRKTANLHLYREQQAGSNPMIWKKKHWCGVHTSQQASHRSESLDRDLETVQLTILSGAVFHFSPRRAKHVQKYTNMIFDTTAPQRAAQISAIR